MQKTQVHILPLGGNSASLQTAFLQVGAEPRLVSSPDELVGATHIVLPGVGHFDRAMRFLNENKYTELLRSLTQTKKAKIMGICLGMQLLGEMSEEGVESGLKLLPIQTKLWRPENPLRFKSPHNGWNTLTKKQAHPLFENVDPQARFYFLHRYRVHCNVPELILAETNYESDFPSVIGNNTCFGVQFHPEKSHQQGLQILANFIHS